MNCPLPSLFAKCVCSTTVCLYCLRLSVAAVAAVFGALVAWKPRKVIDLQIAAYRLINWKMEPLSMDKELRNTRLMGLTVLALGIFSFFYIWLVK